MNLPLAHQTEAETLAALCKAAGDALRLRILKVLEVGSFGVLELCHIVDHKQSGLSHHLKVLAQVGLVETHREGNTIFYRRSNIAGNLHESFMKALFESCNALRLDDTIGARIQHVLDTRTAQSKKFFEKVGANFNEHQERIAQSSTYISATLELIDHRPNTDQDQRVLELGPGEGPLLNDLAQRFKTVTALDTSAEMLQRAQVNNQLANIDFIHGDLSQLSTSEPFDCIVLSMVLHHIAAPITLLQQLKPFLKPSGVLVLTDLAEHEQDWVQEYCGDLWQGFSEQQLQAWIDQAGFIESQSLCLSQRNGFQVISKLYEHATA